MTAFPLKAPGRAKLAEQLGDVQLLDIRDAVFEADLVLAPSCSPQCVAALKGAYPTARLVVVELDDWDFKVRLPGPVKRVLNAGADAYLLADSIEQLAQQLQVRPNASPDQGAKPNELVQPSVDDVILAGIRDVLERRGVEPASVRDGAIAYDTDGRSWWATANESRPQRQAPGA